MKSALLLLALAFFAAETPLRAQTAARAAKSWQFSFGPASAPAGSVAVAASDVFSTERGYGYDLKTLPSGDKTFFFSVAVPEGSYRVSVTFGDAQAGSDNTVKAESRRLMLERVTTQPGEFVTRDFLVNVRNFQVPPPEKNAPGGSAVVLNDREQGSLTWDDKLTLEFNGPHPRVTAVTVVPATGPTLYITGDSTVTDQRFEPGASWGQMMPRFLPGIAVANHAESGETLKSFITGLRLAKVLSQIKAGDYLLIQFGHNDEKRSWPQTYVEAKTTYEAYLRVFIAEARLRGVTPVLITPVQRRTFDAKGKIRNSHGGYPDAVREVAAEQKVPLIDLSAMSMAFYEALGTTKAPLAFSGFGARRDATHHDNFGAYEMAKCITQGLRDAHLPLAEDIAPDFTGFDPSHPDSPDTFALPASPFRSNVAPRGN